MSIVGEEPHSCGGNSARENDAVDRGDERIVTPGNHQSRGFDLVQPRLDHVPAAKTCEQYPRIDGRS